MSRVTYTPLVSDVRNKVGDVVFAAWKGRGYVRRRVVPANPKTDKQVQIRNAMRLIVRSWQSMPSQATKRWNDEAASLGISGFNFFTRRNVAEEMKDNWKELAPGNKKVNPPGSVDALYDAGKLTVNWTLGEADGQDFAYPLVRQVETGALKLGPTDSKIANLTLEWTITLPMGQYMIYLCALDETNGLSASVYNLFNAV